jgi:SAM-dependent methyltransferase
MKEPVCKICARGTVTIFDAPSGTAFYYCRGCGFIFKEEAKIPSPEQEKKRYLQHNNTPGDSGYVGRFRTFIQRSILPYRRRFETALDFGSGPVPVLAGLLQDICNRVDIYDIYFAPAKDCMNHTYDLITCTEVLEHVRDPLAVLGMLAARLNPGGIIAVMTLFHPVGGTARRQGEELPGEAAFKAWWYRRDPTHISFFRPETFRRIASLLDLKVLRLDEKDTVSFSQTQSNAFAGGPGGWFSRKEPPWPPEAENDVTVPVSSFTGKYAALVEKNRNYPLQPPIMDYG